MTENRPHPTAKKTEWPTETVFVCVDDTDDLTKATSTGAICEEIARRLTECFHTHVNTGITRHQLLLDKRVPYTSHNSSMCFDMQLPCGQARLIRSIGWEAIETMRAETANPGLCICTCGAHPREHFQPLVDFGRRAKTEYIPLDVARATADAVEGVMLVGGGETEQGIVGALAGVGLRLWGEDGRFRGAWDMTGFGEGTAQDSGEPGVATVARCVACFKQQGILARFVDDQGNQLSPSEPVRLEPEMKPVLRGRCFTVPCMQGPDGLWHPSTKKSFSSRSGRGRTTCSRYALDPDPEERLDDEKLGLCASCLYRVLANKGIECALECVFPQDPSDERSKRK
jgi:hypothetical protein